MPKKLAAVGEYQRSPSSPAVSGAKWAWPKGRGHPTSTLSDLQGTAGAVPKQNPAGAFPKRYRGTGTTITLGFFDLGMAVSAPFLGRIIDQFDSVGFTPMFYTAAGMMVTVATFYALTAGRYPDVDAVQPSERQTVRDGLPRVETTPHSPARPEPIPALCSAHHED